MSSTLSIIISSTVSTFPFPVVDGFSTTFVDVGIRRRQKSLNFLSFFCAATIMPTHSLRFREFVTLVLPKLNSKEKMTDHKLSNTNLGQILSSAPPSSVMLKLSINSLFSKCLNTIVYPLPCLHYVIYSRFSIPCCSILRGYS